MNLRKSTALAAFVIALLTAPPAAFGATYTVDACQHPDGSYVAPDGWSPTNFGAWTGYGDACSSGGSLNASWDARVAHSDGAGAYWSFAAPPGTSLRRIVAVRSLRTGADQAFGSPVALLETDRGRIEACAVGWGCTAKDGVLAEQLNGAVWMRFGVICSGANGCPSGGETRYSMRQIALTLGDDASPVFSSPPAGTLLSETSRLRIRGLSYQASDVGGGVYAQRLLVDGSVAGASIVDANGGACVKSGDDFSYRMPCKLIASGGLSLDTATLPDGPHQLTLEVYDATEVNKATHGPWAIVADTRPPVIGDVGIAGVARAGEALKAQAAIDGQSPAVGYQWQRAAADGSGLKDIPGATTPAYHLTTADVGRRIVLEVSATDAGGTTTRASTPTAPIGPCIDEAACRAAAGANASDANGPGSVAVPNPVREPGPNGEPPDGGANLTIRLQRGRHTTTRLVARFNERVRVRGTIKAQDGAPIANARVYLMERRPGDDDTTWKVAGVATSTAKGTLATYAPRARRTRDLRLVYYPHGGADANRASGVAELRVRQDALLHVSRSTLRNGQTLRFRGTVRGTIGRSGVPVRLQVRLRTGWLTFERITARAGAHGHFRARYRFRRTTARTRYRFRAMVVPRAGSSYARGYSASRSVIVRP